MSVHVPFIVTPDLFRGGAAFAALKRKALARNKSGLTWNLEQIEC